MKNKNLNVPNALSLSRIILLPFLFLFVHLDMKISFWIAYMVVGATDGLDGFIARKFNQVTEHGKQLDTYADVIFYFSTAYFFYVLFPEYLLPNLGLFGVFLFFYLLAYYVSFRVCKKPRQLHTSILRFCAVLVYFLVLSSFFFNTTYFLSAVFVLFIIGLIEEMLIFKKRGCVDIDTRSLFSK